MAVSQITLFLLFFYFVPTICNFCILNSDHCEKCISINICAYIETEDGNFACIRRQDYNPKSVLFTYTTTRACGTLRKYLQSKEKQASATTILPMPTTTVRTTTSLSFLHLSNLATQNDDNEDLRSSDVIRLNDNREPTRISVTEASSTTLSPTISTRTRKRGTGNLTHTYNIISTNVPTSDTTQIYAKHTVDKTEPTIKSSHVQDSGKFAAPSPTSFISRGNAYSSFIQESATERNDVHFGVDEPIKKKTISIFRKTEAEPTGPFAVKESDEQGKVRLPFILPHLHKIYFNETKTFSCIEFRRQDPLVRKIILSACRLLRLTFGLGNKSDKDVPLFEWLMMNPSQNRTKECIKLKYQVDKCR